MAHRQKILWCDAEANCERLSTREGVADVVCKAQAAGIDRIIVDVKPLGGETLYRSSIAPRLGEVDGYSYPESFDLLSVAIDECRSAGLGIEAAVNVFSEGHRMWKRGPAYARPDWQTVLLEADRAAVLGSGSVVRIDAVDPWKEPDGACAYTRRSGAEREARVGRTYAVVSDGRVTDVLTEAGALVGAPSGGCILSLPQSMAGRISRGDTVSWRATHVFRRAAESTVPSWGVFVNPIGPAREHELSIIREIATGYDVDGLVFDRMRYASIHSDFSETSRSEFEAWLGQGSLSWPDDVLSLAAEPWGAPVRGRFYREWLEWRARQIREFAKEAVNVVQSVSPEMTASVYVGSWYESYYDVGVNWASRGFIPSYDWTTPRYHETGFAELFDCICTGCYYPMVTREEARAEGRPEGATVEAACDLSVQVTMGITPTCGSLYLRDYAGNPDGFARAVQTCLDRTDGVMLFDLVYLDKYDWWPLLRQSFERQEAHSAI